MKTDKITKDKNKKNNHEWKGMKEEQKYVAEN